MIELERVSELGLGTWVFGEEMWGGKSEPREVMETMLNGGVNVIDTAPVYGKGSSEDLVGDVLEELGVRDDVFLSTKCGLEWTKEGAIWRNSTPERLRTEIDNSLERLRTDWIDVYFIHWPDEQTSFSQSVEVLEEFREEGKIRYIGLSNFSVDQIREARKGGTIDFVQPPYNLFEREAEEELFPFCRKSDIRTMTYGALCRGLLTGKYSEKPGEETGDFRGEDPKFTDRRAGYVRAVQQIESFLEEQGYESSLAPLMIRWTLQQDGVDTALVGARNREQALSNLESLEVSLSDEEVDKIRNLADQCILMPIGTEFMAPPSREEVAKLL